MGTTRAVRYTVRIHEDGRIISLGEWRVAKLYGMPGLGRPSDKKLASYVEKFEQSTREGGVNHHLGEITVPRADVYDQRERVVVATYKREG